MTRIDAYGAEIYPGQVGYQSADRQVNEPWKPVGRTVIVDIEPKNVFVVEPAEKYHASTDWWSKSMLWDFRARRSTCHQRYVLGTAPEEASTKPMDLGTLAHAGFLEPDRLDSLYAIYPENILAKNGAISTTEAKDFRDKNTKAGLICLKAADFAVVKAMVSSLQKSEAGKWLTDDARREQSIYWLDKTFDIDIPCRCRPDVLIVRDFALALDIKSSADITPYWFRKRFEDMGYWLQDAHYSDGIESLTGLKPRFLFVVVESIWPHDCVVYELGEPDRINSWAARRGLVGELAKCIQSGDWSDAWINSINTLNLRNKPSMEAA